VSFNLNSLLRRAPRRRGAGRADPRVIMRIVLGVLLAANIAAALVLFRPWGASPEELEQQLGELKAQVSRQRASVERLRALVAKSAKARREGEAFMRKYFMDRRTASSAIVSELGDVARRAGIKQEEHTFAYEPIEGSENLSMMTISGNYEGSYANLVKFINLLERSPRFLILDTLTAAPERTAGMLNMNFKMNAFVIDEGRQPMAERTRATTGAEPAKAAPGGDAATGEQEESQAE